MTLSNRENPTHHRPFTLRRHAGPLLILLVLPLFFPGAGCASLEIGEDTPWSVSEGTNHGTDFSTDDEPSTSDSCEVECDAMCMFDDDTIALNSNTIDLLNEEVRIVLHALERFETDPVELELPVGEAFSTIYAMIDGVYYYPAEHTFIIERTDTRLDLSYSDSLWQDVDCEEPVGRVPFEQLDLYVNDVLVHQELLSLAAFTIDDTWNTCGYRCDHKSVEVSVTADPLLAE